MTNLRSFLLAWRTVALPDREVIDAFVHPAHAGPSPEFAEQLDQWRGPHYWSDEDGTRRLVLIRPMPRRPERWLRHSLLFLATLLTTMFSGAVFAGVLPLFPSQFPEGWWKLLPAGWTYAVPLLGILLAHEMGHYLTARRYAVDVSPPYFLPWPAFPFFIGTLGAFIRIRSPIVDRRQLIDIGAAGPIAGFLVAVPVLVAGLLMSQPVGETTSAPSLIMRFDGQVWTMGHSAVTLAATKLLRPDAAALLLHPAAVAGWIGVFVTMLNLIPLAQLDGGHILYALTARRQVRVALLFWLALLLMGRLWWGWAVWAILVLVLSRGRLRHPSVLDAYRPLPKNRRGLGVACVGLFLATFTPIPFSL